MTKRRSTTLYLGQGQMSFENSERNQPPTGLDIFKVPRGKTVADAMANNGCASHFSYTPGQEDVIVEITASDLGVLGALLRQFQVFYGNVVEGD